MKILMINVVCGIRSTGRICTDLATALEAQGHKVKIAYGREIVPDKYQKYAVRIGKEIDVYVHAGLSRLTDSAGFHSTWYTRRFIEWVRKFNPDVIHLHNIHGYYINVEILFDYLRTCGKRIIWTLHDCWSFTGHSVFCDAIECTKWKNGCNQCPQIKEYPKSFMDKSSRNWRKKKELFTGIPNLQLVTPSHWLAGLVKESFLKDSPVTVIHNGIDTSQFYPLKNDFREFHHIEDKFIILAVASTWNEMKGLNDYITLSKALDDRFKIVMVGLSKKQIESMPKDILALPRTTSTKELTVMYSSCDVFLNLTYTDNYPTVNLEAAACGAKIVTYDTGGSPESAEVGKKPIIVPKGDVRAIERELLKLFEEPGLTNTSEDGIGIAHHVRDIRDTVDDYVAEYEEV